MKSVNCRHTVSAVKLNAKFVNEKYTKFVFVVTVFA